MSQRQIGKDLPTAFARCSFNKAEKNYSTAEKELAAIVWGIKHFRPYLYGRKFKVVSEGSNFLSSLFKSIRKLLKIRYKQRPFILNRMVVWKGALGASRIPAALCAPRSD